MTPRLCLAQAKSNAYLHGSGAAFCLTGHLAMATLLDRMETTAKEVGVLEEQMKVRWAEMGGLPGAAVPSLEEAVALGEKDVPRERFVLLARYWEVHGAIEVKREILKVIKDEMGKEKTAETDKKIEDMAEDT